MAAVLCLSQRIPRRPLLQSYKTRTYHPSTPCRDLVGPPHPISHIRPILYEDPPSPPPRLRHPYSLYEFKSGPNDESNEYELQHKLLRQQLDSLHQTFWLDVSVFVDSICHNNSGTNRATPDSMPQRRPSSVVCLPPHLLATERKPFPSSSNNGSCKRKIAQMLTPTSGEGEIFNSSKSQHA